MEELFQTEIPLWAILLLVVAMTALYFYLLKAYQTLLEQEETAPSAPSQDQSLGTAGLDYNRLVAITAAAKVVLNKKKRLRSGP